MIKVQLPLLTIGMLSIQKNITSLNYIQGITHATKAAATPEQIPRNKIEELGEPYAEPASEKLIPEYVEVFEDEGTRKEQKKYSADKILQSVNEHEIMSCQCKLIEEIKSAKSKLLQSRASLPIKISKPNQP
jgi:hypothetical protein